MFVQMSESYKASSGFHACGGDDGHDTAPRVVDIDPDAGVPAKPPLHLVVAEDGGRGGSPEAPVASSAQASSGVLEQVSLRPGLNHRNKGSKALGYIFFL